MILRGISRVHAVRTESLINSDTRIKFEIGLPQGQRIECEIFLLSKKRARDPETHLKEAKDISTDGVKGRWAKGKYQISGHRFIGLNSIFCYKC